MNGKVLKKYFSPPTFRQKNLTFVQELIKIKQINFSVEKWNLHDVHVIVDVHMM